MAYFKASAGRGARSAPGSPAQPKGPRPVDPGQQHRRSLIAKVHLAKKMLALDDDDYRDMMQAHGGARSAKDCSDAGLIAFLKWAESRGFTATAKKPGSSRRRAADHPTARKARAMWISLWNLGVIASSSEAALEAFARRQLKCDAMQWADQGQMFKLIEALKAMAERAGWSQQTSGHDGPQGALRQIKVNLLKAQAVKLKAMGQGEPTWSLNGMALRLCNHTCFGTPSQWPEGDLDKIASRFGELIRNTPKEGDDA